MGRLTNGINGPFVGSIGNVVGSSINGVPYAKGKYKERTKNISEKEKANRHKFAIAQAWLSPLVYFVRVGFKGYSQRAQGFVAAKSYLMKNAMDGEGFDVSIDPALVKVSAGDLPLSTGITVAKAGTDTIEFSWDTQYINGASSYDQVMVLAYDIGDQRPRYNTTGQFRHVGSEVLRVASGRTYHLYLAFTAHDRSRQSDSVYLGEMSM